MTTRRTHAVTALVFALTSMLALFVGASTAAAQNARAAATDPTPATGVVTHELVPTPVAGPSITLSMPESGSRPQASNALKILALLTILSIAPGILISMTSFTRIVVVLSFVRQAVGTQNAPPNQVILALSLLLSFVVMAPVGTSIYETAVSPYLDEQIDEQTAMTRSSSEMRTFLLRQTREDDLLLFYELTHVERPDTPDDVSLHLLVPAFMISELRTGFEMGFLLFLPFVLVDLIVGSILTSMGMVMMPPTMISTPIKLLLFVLVDGWSLIARSIVASFG